MASPLGIANQALTRLGAVALDAFDPDAAEPVADDSENGRRALATYATARARLLSAYAWSWTLKRAELVEDGTAPVSRFTRQFDMPADALRPGPRAVYERVDDNYPTRQRWQMLGRKLQTDMETVFVEYQFRPPEADWPVPFEAYMVLVCMSEWCYAVTDESSFKRQIDAEMMVARIEAIRDDQETSPLEDLQEFGIHDARFEASF